MERLFNPEKKFSEIDWLKSFLNSIKTGSPEEFMRLAIAISDYSAKHAGGPFGAVICDKNGNLLECGCNEVVLSNDSTCHAEINVIRRAQQATQTYDLSSLGCTLYTSCAPCIQCFGAIYWSGIKHVVAGALKDDAEAIGFSEGCITKETWDDAINNKGIKYELGFLRDEAQAVLLNYQGKMY